MDKIEITIEKLEEGFRIHLTEGEVANRQWHVKDEYDVGEKITEYLGETSHE